MKKINEKTLRKPNICLYEDLCIYETMEAMCKAFSVISTMA